jgi:ATP-dependent protease ClpP protease subunit
MIFLNFNTPIVEKSAHALMAFLAEQTRKGENEVYILLSSSGGLVPSGVTLYNFIMSLPIKIVMHNIGIVDSIANIVFLAGIERYAVPHSSFLFHGVGFEISQPTRFEEKQVKERLLSIERDQRLIGQIIAENSKLDLNKIKDMFLEAQTLTPEQAKEVDIIQDIREVKVPAGANIQSFVF